MRTGRVWVAGDFARGNADGRELYGRPGDAVSVGLWVVLEKEGMSVGVSMVGVNRMHGEVLSVPLPQMLSPT